jgi:hypothetical protein
MPQESLRFRFLHVLPASLSLRQTETCRYPAGGLRLGDLETRFYVGPFGSTLRWLRKKADRGTRSVYQIETKGLKLRRK